MLSEKRRIFSAEQASETVVFEDDFGIERHVVIHIAHGIEDCPTCGHSVPMKDGVLDIEAAIAQAKHELEQQVDKLVRHCERNNYDIERIRATQGKPCTDCRK